MLENSRSGFGINRKTWNQGAAIGRGLKRGIDYLYSGSTVPGGAPKKGSSGKVWNALKRKRKSPSKKSSIRTGVVMNEGTGGQCSYFNGPVGKHYLPKHVEDALAPVKLVNASSAQLKSGVGVQAALVPLAQLQPSLATGFTTDKMSRVLYESVSSDVTMNNIYLSNCYLIIYDVICRKDVSLSAISTPLLAWVQGDADEAATNASTILGSTPWQTEAFNEYYKVMQVTNVVLAAGATHVHKVRLHPNRVISSAYSTYSPFGFKDVTYFTMIEIHGSPANDVTTQTQVSVGVGGLNIIADGEQTIKLIQNNKPQIVTANTLLTSFTVGEQTVNLGGSTIVPQAEG